MKTAVKVLLISLGVICLLLASYVLIWFMQPKPVNWGAIGRVINAENVEGVLFFKGTGEVYIGSQKDGLTVLHDWSEVSVNYYLNYPVNANNVVCFSIFGEGCADPRGMMPTACFEPSSIPPKVDPSFKQWLKKFLSRSTSIGTESPAQIERNFGLRFDPKTGKGVRVKPRIDDYKDYPDSEGQVFPLDGSNVRGVRRISGD